MVWAESVMGRRILLLLAGAFMLLVSVVGHYAGKGEFAPETKPEGAYARIALAIAERRPRDTFAYLETEAQWASYTIRDDRKKACERVRAAYPPHAAAPVLTAWQDEAAAADGADVFALLASRKGWIARLERDLSGAKHVDVQGERATVVTARNTRYPFRRRDNGIWGLTIFTADLQAEAERAARDLEVVEQAAKDYERARAP